MAADIGIKIDNREVMEALGRAPIEVGRSIEHGIDRAGHEVAREGKRQAPKAFSTLANSIRSSRISPFTREIAPGVNYGRAVEEGTKPGTMPPPDALIPWLKQKRFGTAVGFHGPQVKRKYNSKNAAHDAELRDRAFGLARYIKEHGTRAQRYMEPTRIKMESRVLQIVRESAMDGLREAGLA